jgi:hypothetical protein
VPDETSILNSESNSDTRTVSLTIIPPDGNHVESLTLANPTAVGGDPVFGSITLDQTARSGGVTASLTSSNTAIQYQEIRVQTFRRAVRDERNSAHCIQLRSCEERRRHGEPCGWRVSSRHHYSTR